MEHQTPGIAELLHAAGQGDRAAFAALYDHIARNAHGMSTALFPNESEATRATQAGFTELWMQAPHFSFSFPTASSDAPARNRSVESWALKVIQFMLATTYRQDSTAHPAAPAEIDAVAAQLPELTVLSDAQRQAISLAWLGGRDIYAVAEQLKVSLPTMKARLRDGCTRLVRAFMTAITGQEEIAKDPILARPITPENTARHGQPVTFSTDISRDLENGLHEELAASVALNALSEEDMIRIEAWLARQEPSVIDRWRQRIALLERMLAWAFRRVANEPPHLVLENTLKELPEQNIGMGFMEDFEEGEDTRIETSSTTKRTVLIGIIIALLLAVGLAIWGLSSGGDSTVKAVDNAKDLYTSSPQDLDGGGTVQSHVSGEEDRAYLSFSGVPELDENERYQVWLLEDAGATPVSTGTFTAEEMTDNEVNFRGVKNFKLAWITIESANGSDAPSGEVLAQVPLGR